MESQGFYDYSSPLTMKIISHLADADGLASEAINKAGREVILDQIGRPTTEGFPDKIDSTRVMDISSRNLKDIVDGHNSYVFADLGTLEPEMLDKYNIDSLIIDHHEFKEGDTKIINPDKHGIDGGKELSASLLSSIYIDSLADQVDVSDNIRDELNLMHVLGISGAKADMQGNEGNNKAVYDELEKRKVINELPLPFFGYFTKPLSSVLAESEVPFNLRYRLPSEKELRSVLGDEFKGKKVEDSYEELKFKVAFDKKEEKLVANMYHTDDDFGLDRFDDYRDDYKANEVRTKSANAELGRNGLSEPDHQCDIKDKGSLYKMYKDNVIAFSDPAKRDDYLSMLKEPQYAVNSKFGLVNGNSVSELANLMTALSSLGHGELFLNTVSKELRGEDVSYELDKIKEIHASYRGTISEMMGQVEDKLWGEGLEEISEGVYHLNMDFIDLPVNVESMIGKCGGLIAKGRYLPDNYGVLFTSYTKGNKGDVKVSGRVNQFPGHGDVDLGGLFSKHAALGLANSGGGHKEAASGRYERLDDFIKYAAESDFGVPER
ncbi:MAG: hypothetical protein ACQEP1_04375 [Nanobdellota archaeon]